MKSFDRESLAWAAGFFDGEGCTRAIEADGPHGVTHHTEMAITQIHRDTLERFQDAVGGLGYIVGPDFYGGRKNGLWRWRLTDWRGIQAVLAMLWPWLGPHKKQQARVKMAAAVADRRTRHVRELSCPSGHARAKFGRRTRSGNWACRECQRLHAQRYRAANLAAAREYQARWAREHYEPQVV